MNNQGWIAESDQQRSKNGQNAWKLAGASLAVLLAVASAGFAGQEATGGVESRFQMTVRIYNYAGVKSGTLRRAEEEGTRIFRKAGVEVAWLACDVSHSPEGQLPSCETPVGAVVVNMRLLSPSMAGKYSSIQGEMGFAVVSARAGRASDAGVFSRRVEDIAAYEIAFPSQILGCAMAHEIGHLLLGPGHHSLTGVMHGNWDRQSLEDASRGQLFFTRDQAQLIRNEVQTRMEMAQESVTDQPAARESAAVEGR